MYVQYVSTEAGHNEGEALWGVSRAPEVVEVIMVSCRRPLRSTHLLVGCCRHSSRLSDKRVCCVSTLTRQLDQSLQMTLRMTSSNQTGRLNFESLRRCRCGCCFFHFTPLKWTGVAGQKDII